MESMYDRIRRMTECEMNNFILWIFLAGQAHGSVEYFESITSQNAEDVMQTMNRALNSRYHF